MYLRTRFLGLQVACTFFFVLRSRETCSDLHFRSVTPGSAIKMLQREEIEVHQLENVCKNSQEREDIFLKQ